MSVVSGDPNAHKDYLAHASLTIGDHVVRDVPCSIILPILPTESPKLHLSPSLRQWEHLSRVFEAALSARFPRRDGTTSADITASTVYLSGAKKRDWAPDLSETVIIAEPRDLSVTEYLHSRPIEAREQNSSTVFFWISPNKMLGPAVAQTVSFTGDLTYERVRTTTCDLMPGVTLTFNLHFRPIEQGSSEFRQKSYLVAEAQIPHQARETLAIRNSILPKLDDLLLLASLASRTRTACVGWQASDDDTVTRFYRREISVPTGYALSSHDLGLVPLIRLEDFLEAAWRNFNEYRYPDALRAAIWAIVPIRSRNLEEDFLSLFGGLEELLLGFRRDHDLLNILPHDEWKQFRRYIKNAVKSYAETAIMDSSRRDWIYQKLGEMNRVPLVVGFDQFCKHYDLQLADLWPLFDSKGGPSLYSIRNRLVHSESIPLAAIEPFSCATAHLRWILERIALTLLDWPIGHSDVTPSHIASAGPSLVSWSDQRTRLKALLND